MHPQDNPPNVPPPPSMGVRHPSAQPAPPPRPPKEGVEMDHLGMGLLLETLLKRPENLYAEFKGVRVAAVCAKLLGIGLGSYLVYGLLVGSFSGGMQWWASPLKIAGGMTFSALICLPSLYIFGCLAGSNATLKHCLALQAGLLALSGVLLIGFLPVGWVFSTSIESVGFMGFLHLLFWWVALLFGIRLLRVGMRAFGANALTPVRLWSLIFFLVCLQMTTTLRPLLGPGETLLTEGKRFFLAHWTENIFEKADHR